MENCCTSCHTPARSRRYRRILQAALLVNFAMFVLEIVAGMRAGSVSLLGDSLDFLGDAANYGISLFVLDKALTLRAKASLLKGYTMGAFGMWVILSACYMLLNGGVPDAYEMGVVGTIALFANILCAVLLYAFREGDSNMRGVWICSRNDAVGNVLVVLAGVAVSLTQSHWPDLAVAFAMGWLGISGARSIIRHARTELAAEAATSAR